MTLKLFLPLPNASLVPRSKEMSTLQKFAALPIDKYIDILDKLKALKQDKSPADTVHTPVNYQDGAGGDNEIIGQRGGQSEGESHQSSDSSSSKAVAPPPGLPAEDDMVNGSARIGGADNWIDVWQALK